MAIVALHAAYPLNLSRALGRPCTSRKWIYVMLQATHCIGCRHVHDCTHGPSRASKYVAVVGPNWHTARLPHRACKSHAPSSRYTRVPRRPGQIRRTQCAARTRPQCVRESAMRLLDVLSIKMCACRLHRLVVSRGREHDMANWHCMRLVCALTGQRYMWSATRSDGSIDDGRSMFDWYDHRCGRSIFHV
jgi:hypothetical protein